MENTQTDTTTNPPPNGGTSPIAPQSPLADATAKYTTRLDDLAEDEKREFAAGEAAQAPYRQKLLKMLESPNAAQAHLEKVKEQPKPEDYQKFSMEFASAFAVMGALAGRFTRAGGTAALNAFSGALKGWQQGNLQAYENAAKEWEQASRKTLENNNIEIEKYREIMADKKANIDQMMAAMNLVAAEHQNKLMFDATLEKNYTMAFNAVDKMTNAQNKAQGAVDRLTGLRGDQRTQVQAKVDELNSNPQLSQRLMQDKPNEWLQIKGAAEALGIKLNEPAAGTQPLPKVPSTPRSAPAMFIAKYQQDHPHATAEDIASAASIYTTAQARARTIGSRGANVDVAIDEAVGAAQQALQASSAVPRGNYVPINQIQQSIRRGTSSPEQRRFDVANASLITAYAQTMSRTGTNTVTAQNRAAEVLNTADSPEAYKAGVDQLLTEMRIVQQAVRDIGGTQAGEGAVPAGGGNVIRYDSQGNRVQ